MSFGARALGLALLGLALLFARRWMRPRVRAAAMAGLALAVSCSPPSVGTYRDQLTSTASTTFLHTGFAAGPAVFTDGDGHLLEERRYEPFGEPVDAKVHTATGDVIGNPDLVARDLNELNKRTEAATGWSDHGARWMAPETARWLSTDPPVAAPDDKFMLAPWALHPYQYAQQNPVIYWDPDGNNPEFSDLKYVTVRGGNPVRNQADDVARHWRSATPVLTSSAPYIIGAALVYGCARDPVGCALSVAHELFASESDERPIYALSLSMKGGPGALDPGAALRLLREGISSEMELAGATAVRDGVASGIKWKSFSKGRLAEHFAKHGSEFGNITQNQYLGMAKDFAAEAGEFVEGQEGNVMVKWDPATRRMFVGNAKAREIRTFYIADERDVDPFQSAMQLARSLANR